MDTLTFDIETTSADAKTARIVQLAIRAVSATGEVIVCKSKFYNPGVKIEKSATEVHGITDKDVRDCPSFEEDARKLKKLFENKIIITFNGMVFDIPVLLNEFDRAGVEITLSGKFIDVLQIERKLHSNKLTDVYKRYSGEELKNAHDALGDILATDYVLMKQMERLPKDADLYELSGTKDIVDFYGKFKRDSEGYLCYKFGKHIDKRIIDEAAYADWMLKENFPSQVKQCIRDERKKHSKTQFTKPNSTPTYNKYKPQTSGSLIKKWEAVPIVDDDLPF